MLVEDDELEAMRLVVERREGRPAADTLERIGGAPGHYRSRFAEHSDAAVTAFPS